jgi:hypothetical protein
MYNAAMPSAAAQPRGRRVWSWAGAMTLLLLLLLQIVEANYVLGTRLVWSGITSTSRCPREPVPCLRTSLQVYALRTLRAALCCYGRRWAAVVQ